MIGEFDGFVVLGKKEGEGEIREEGCIFTEILKKRLRKFERLNDFVIVVELWTKTVQLIKGNSFSAFYEYLNEEFLGWKEGKVF
ncbi:MAG: hypothetical protein WC435_02690 [Candidatus Paceibacterota bacterium]